MYEIGSYVGIGSLFVTFSTVTLINLKLYLILRLDSCNLKVVILKYLINISYYNLKTKLCYPY